MIRQARSSSERRDDLVIAQLAVQAAAISTGNRQTGIDLYAASRFLYAKRGSRGNSELLYVRVGLQNFLLDLCGQAHSSSLVRLALAGSPLFLLNLL